MILTRGNSPRCVTTGSVSRNVNLGGERVDAWRAIHSLGAVHVTEKLEGRAVGGDRHDLKGSVLLSRRRRRSCPCDA
jgi:hypothetical protein